MTPEQREALIQAASRARQHAYVPYSNYQVGAALLTPSGEIITGCNIENAAYGPTMCAERCAVFKAVSEGQREFEAIAVVTETAGSPCGTCRQVLFEFAPEALVIIADTVGEVHEEFTVNQLLPRGFGPDYLP